MKRKKLIDKKLQLKTSFAVIRFYFISFFLIIALLGIYLVFTKTGQEWLRKYVGLNISEK